MDWAPKPLALPHEVETQCLVVERQVNPRPPRSGVRVGDVAAHFLFEEEDVAQLLLGQAEALELTLLRQLAAHEAGKTGLFGLRSFVAMSSSWSHEEIELTTLTREAPRSRADHTWLQE